MADIKLQRITEANPSRYLEWLFSRRLLSFL